MNIIVLAKVVKHLHAQTGSDPKNNYIGPGDIVDMINPADEMAIEEALRIKDEDESAEVSVMSLGDTSAEKELRRFLAMGSDRATHVLCDDYEALDSWTTANVLARAAVEERFRLILCGRAAIDDNAGLVGAYVAEILGIPHVSRVVRMQELRGDREVVVHRTVERHNTEIVACTLPALLTVETGINIARTPSVPAMLKARNRTIETRTLDDLAQPGLPLGPAMNRTETIRLSRPKPRRSAAQQPDPQLSAAERVKLMMKGGGAKPAQASGLREGISEEVLAEMERLLRACGVTFKPTA